MHNCLYCDTECVTWAYKTPRKSASTTCGFSVSGNDMKYESIVMFSQKKAHKTKVSKIHKTDKKIKDKIISWYIVDSYAC